MRILVTGSSGFIGSRLVEHLRSQGHEVHEYDIRSSLKFPAEKVDLVYHLASHVNAFASVAEPNQALENVEILYKVLEWMRMSGSLGIIFSSSREVYSGCNPYGASKVAGEAFIRAYCQAYGMAGVSARLANVYGPGNLGHRFIEATIMQARNGDKIKVYGGHEKVLNFLYIDDAVAQLAQCVEFLRPTHNKVVDLAFPVSYSLPEVAEIIMAKVGSASELEFLPNRRGETMRYVPKTVIFTPTVTLEEGIDKCIASLS